LGIPAGYPDYVLYKMIAVVKDGKEVKMSKRAGTSVSVRDLIDWTSRDAVRFFLASRKADTEFTFDVDLALKANDENPVFYVQYAHARICSIISKANAQAKTPVAAPPDLSLLTATSEAALMLKLAEYPEMLTRAAADLAPHDVAFYLRELAAAFHTYYASERVLVDNSALLQARLALLSATAQVLRNALAMLGVSAPQAMAREETSPAESAA
jgi:arginyl-tRNA synthetase